MKNIGNHRYIGTLILRIYKIYQGYIGYIRDISANILIQNIDRQKIDQNLWNVRKKTLKNEIRSIIDILKLLCWRNWYMYDMIWDIKFNYVVVNFVSIYLLWS